MADAVLPTMAVIGSAGGSPVGPDSARASLRVARKALEVLKEAVRTERVRQRMSQSDAAARVGRSRKWISDYERGLSHPSAEALFELAEELGIEIAVRVPEDRL